MAYDEALAARIRELVAGESGVEEQQMFGGLAFLAGGNMAVAASGQGGLLVRVDPAESQQLIQTTQAEEMVMRGRSMKGWLRLDSADVEGSELDAWVERACRSLARCLRSVSVRFVGVIVVLVVIILALLLAGALVGLAFELLWLALTGLIIGGLGRLVLPGRQQIGLVQTALVGIAASLLGGLLADIFDAGWIVRSLVAVALAAIGVTLLESRSRTTSSA